MRECETHTTRETIMVEESNKQDLWKCPAVRSPTVQQLKDVSENLRLQCGEQELAEFKEYIDGELLGGYERLNELVPPSLPVRYPRTPGYRPQPEDNKNNACVSSWSNDTGPVTNLHNPLYGAGGSSGGSAAALVNGEIDMALGADQGGSIRIPASYCGIVGLKPTWGLVPYTGAMPIEVTLDHLGPMANTVMDCALLLEVIAGYDGGLDPRQPSKLVVPEYSKLLTDELDGKKVGVVKEGFNGCDEDVIALVKRAAGSLTEAGAIVEEVSIPIHADGSLEHSHFSFHRHTVGLVACHHALYTLDAVAKCSTL